MGHERPTLCARSRTLTCRNSTIWVKRRAAVSPRCSVLTGTVSSLTVCSTPSSGAHRPQPPRSSWSLCCTPLKLLICPPLTPDSSPAGPDHRPAHAAPGRRPAASVAETCASGSHPSPNCGTTHLLGATSNGWIAKAGGTLTGALQVSSGFWKGT